MITNLVQYQDTQLFCVSSQEGCAAHKCVIYKNRLVTNFNLSYLYNSWADLYQIMDVTPSKYIALQPNLKKIGLVLQQIPGKWSPTAGVA